MKSYVTVLLATGCAGGESPDCPEPISHDSAISGTDEAPPGPGDAELGLPAPVVVATRPAHMDLAVDPATPVLEVTFSEDMAASSSWLEVEGYSPELGEARWTDGRTAQVDVSLEPGRDYVLILNGFGFYGFQALDGQPALPSTVAFRTSEAR